MNKIRSEEGAEYSQRATTASGDAVIAQAISILEERMRLGGEYISSPETSAAYLRLKLAQSPYEIFGVLFLTNRHQVIAFEELFRGTIDGATVSSREVVRDCLSHNAAAVILAHNHPSGLCTPSQADLRITQRLKDALGLIDVRVLDHIIVSGTGYHSMAEHGEI